MGIFRRSSDNYIKDANKASEQGYQRSSQYMQPYTQNAGQDFDAARNFLYGSAQHHFGNGNPNDRFNDYLDMSPMDLLTQAMGGYEESGAAQMHENYAMSGINNAMTAQGMGGSSNNALLDAGITDAIKTNDMDHFLGQLLQSFGVQEDILGDWNKQSQGIEKMFGDVVKTENRASSGMSQNAIRTGQQESSSFNRAASNNRNASPIKELASLLSTALGLAAPVSGAMTKQPIVAKNYGSNDSWLLNMGYQ